MMPDWLTATDLKILLPMLALHLAVGTGVGIVHFRAVAESAKALTGGGSVWWVIALIVGRLVLTGAVLAVAALEGAPQLIAVAAGLLVGRFIVMRRAREAQQ